MKKIYDTIYKVDSKGKVRVWYMEQLDDKYRTWDGTQEGKIKSSEWRIAIPTNIGRSNERDGISQAEFEIEATYKTKLEKDYHLTIEAARSGGSHIFEVMLADKYKNFQPGHAQPKLDGFRCVVNKDGMWSRSGKRYVSSPHILEALSHLFEENPDLILDGELYNHDLHDNFDEIQSLVTVKSDKNLTQEHYDKTKLMVKYYIYDVPSHPGSFSERHRYLVSLIENLEDPSIHSVITHQVNTQEEYDNFHGEWMSLGYEGSMWRADTPYENRRTKNLLKRKDFIDEEFDLLLIEEGQGNWSGSAKSVYFKVPGAIINPGDLYVELESDDILKYDSENIPTRDAVRVSKGGIKGSRDRGIDLLNEKHDVVTIKYFQLTPDGVPRFGVATKFHGQKREY